MSKSKIDFLADLLVSKKVDLANKERFLTLAAAELKKTESSEASIKMRLEELENRINKHIQGTIISSSKIETHSPHLTAKHMSLFKEEGSKLKRIVHDYPNSDNDTFDYDKITKEAIVEFNSIAKELPRRLLGIISMFLKPSKKNPKEKTITYLSKQYETWWSPTIVKWCENHPGIHPNTDEFLRDQIINPFKYSIEIRDGKHFVNALEHKLGKTYPNGIDLNINYEGIKSGTRFFTSVDMLMTGISILFSPMISRKNNSKEVKITSYIEEIDNEHFVTVIKIVHLNSNADVDYNNEPLINGDLGTAKSLFRSLCDWQIIANYKNGTFVFNPLSISSDDRPFVIEEKAEGFTHKLIFY